ncbi:hypothetical protein ACIHEI_17335 [Kitasatospora sp. NPDC051984]|uniref:hypothetical protein n=1 Tax=Kitasatospora sp. NPDC051984 TaxID=3364059 RepID=UPI0037CC07B0
MVTHRGGVVVTVAAGVLAAALTGCSGGVSAPRPLPAPSGARAVPASAGAAWPVSPDQELAELRAALALPAQPFSAVLNVEVTDGTRTVRRQGVVNVSDDQQTGALSVISASAEQPARSQAYLTITREAAYTRSDDAAWVRSPRPPEPLLTDHRVLARELLRNDPGSFRGRARIRTLRGGMGFHLVGRLPLATVAGAFDAVSRSQLAQHYASDCVADLLVDGDGRLSVLTLTCEADGYRLRSTTGLAEYGPVAETSPPADL